MRAPLNIFESSELVLVRSPLFPQIYLFDLFESIKDNKILDFFNNELAKEALFIASPDLFKRMELLLNNQIADKNKISKIELSLLKYIIRMCFRCTPFGLFATCSVGKVSDRSEFIYESQNRIERHARFDMDLEYYIYEELMKSDDLTARLRYFPNSSIYQFGSNFRYTEYRFNKSQKRTYHLVQLDYKEYLEKIINLARDGKRIDELIKIVFEDKVDYSQAKYFIIELIRNQILIPEIAPSITGPNYLDILMSKLADLNFSNSLIGNLTESNLLLKSCKQENSLKIFQKIFASSEAFNINVKRRSIIQVDAYRPTISNGISKEITSELQDCLKVLVYLDSKFADHDPFRMFKDKFNSRYEGRKVSLVEILDTESGLGYEPFFKKGRMESSLIDDLPLFINKVAQGPSNLNINRLKFDVYEKSLANNLINVNLDVETMELAVKNNINSNRLPDTMHCMAHLVEDSNKSSSQIVTNGFFGPSSVNLLGRFCYLDKRIEEEVLNSIEKEEVINSDTIYAEIVHLPESRTGNILKRPHLRNYEIVYLCNSTLPDDNKIYLTDLMVSVENDMVLLWSKKLNKRIIPRLSTAHNYHTTTLPVYKFLCDLQFQNIDNYGWNWGDLETRKFLPRVTIGRCIISKARWILKRTDFQKSSEGIQRENLTELITKLNLPEYVIYSQGDNELLLKINDEMCLKILIDELNKHGQIKLKEYLKGEYRLANHKGEDYNSELLFSFSKTLFEEKKSKVTENINGDFLNSDRNIIPGGNWLYFKIYCGYKVADHILSKIIFPFFNEMKLNNSIDEYFFIRYNDPDHHLRLRIFKSQCANFWDILKELNNELKIFLDSGLIVKVQIDTYNREIERYGAINMKVTEKLFYFNSKSVLQFISNEENSLDFKDRWKTAMKVVDMILNDFGFSPVEKRSFIGERREAYFNSYIFDVDQKKAVSNKYQTQKKEIEQLFIYDSAYSQKINSGLALFENESDEYRNSVNEILLNCKKTNLSLKDWLGSYLHMFFNRIFITEQVAHEVVIYDFLFRYYDSLISRKNGT